MCLAGDYSIKVFWSFWCTWNIMNYDGLNMCYDAVCGWIRMVWWMIRWTLLIRLHWPLVCRYLSPSLVLVQQILVWYVSNSMHACYMSCILLMLLLWLLRVCVYMCVRACVCACMCVCMHMYLHRHVGVF